MRRNFIKLFSVSVLSLLLLPYKFLYAVTKKIINQNLTDEQKYILFNEGTERPFTSSLLHEKRDGFYHCANCDAKLFSSNSKYDSGTGWPSFTESLPGAFNTKTILCQWGPLQFNIKFILYIHEEKFFKIIWCINIFANVVAI